MLDRPGGLGRAKDQPSLPRGPSLGSNVACPNLRLNPPPGFSGSRAVRQSIHAALAPSLLPLSAFHAASSMPVVKQRVWMNSPPLVRYTLELITTPRYSRLITACRAAAPPCKLTLSPFLDAILFMAAAAIIL